MEAGRDVHGPAICLFFLLGFFFNIYHFTALVMTAVGANGVRQAHLTAVAALYQVARFQRVMGTPAIAATGGVFSLWMWGHVLLLYSSQKRP
jgi:hypothetical protein